MSGARRNLGDTMADEIRSLGVEPALAAAVAADFLVRSPISRRDGVGSLAFRLQRDRGIAPACARPVAAMLLGIERLAAGHPFEALQHELRESGMDEASVLSASLDASRIQRDFAAAHRDGRDVFDPNLASLDGSPAFAALGLGIGALVVALLLHLLGVG